MDAKETRIRGHAVGSDNKQRYSGDHPRPKKSIQDSLAHILLQAQSLETLVVVFAIASKVSAVVVPLAIVPS